MRLFLVDRLFYAFMKNQEGVLVRTAAQSRDRLAYLLVLQPNPSYQALFSLWREQKIFDSIMETLHQTQKYARCLAFFMGDPKPGHAPAFVPILRAGFLIHHRMASIETAEDKVAYVNKLPPQPWTLLCLFSGFLSAVLSVFALNVGSVSFFEALAIFSGMQVVEDCVKLRHDSITFGPTTDVAFYRAIQPRHLPYGRSILSPKSCEDHLVLSSHLASRLNFGYQAPIQIVSFLIDAFGEHVFEEILTTSGILTPDADECVLFDVLKRTPITDKRYRNVFEEKKLSRPTWILV